GNRRIRDDAPELALRVAPAGAPGVDGFGVVPAGAPIGTVPFRDGVGRPRRGTIRVALITGVWRAELHRQIRSRDTEAVIAPAVDDHVRALEHVTRHALRGLRARLVEVVLRPVVCGGRVTLGAQRVPGLAQSPAVRLVAVRARHAGLVHLALEE